MLSRRRAPTLALQLARSPRPANCARNPEEVNTCNYVRPAGGRRKRDAQVAARYRSWDTGSIHVPPSKDATSVPSVSGIFRMLANTFYLGLVKYGDELLPGKHPAIISRETFDVASFWKE